MFDHASRESDAHGIRPPAMPAELMNIDAHRVEAAAADGPLGVLIEVYAQITAAMNRLAASENDQLPAKTWRTRALAAEIPKWLRIAEGEGWFPQ